MLQLFYSDLCYQALQNSVLEVPISDFGSSCFHCHIPSFQEVLLSPDLPSKNCVHIQCALIVCADLKILSRTDDKFGDNIIYVHAHGLVLH